LLLSIAIDLDTSRHGIPTPTLQISIPKPGNHRHLKAALHEFSARLELATPPKDAWVITIGYAGDYHGRIEIELIQGTTEEADRAMALLKEIAG
jgi:hypothetical protein